MDAVPADARRPTDVDALKHGKSDRRTTVDACSAETRTPASSPCINNGGANVERFNYRNMEGLVVNTLDGDDYVVSDDVIAADHHQPRHRQRPRAGRPGVPLRARQGPGGRTDHRHHGRRRVRHARDHARLAVQRRQPADDDQRRRRQRRVHRLPQRRRAEPQRRRRRRPVHRPRLRAQGLDRQRARPHRHEGRRRGRHHPVRRQRPGRHRRRRRLRHRPHRRHRVRRRLRRHRQPASSAPGSTSATSTSRSWSPTAPRATTASSSCPPASRSSPRSTAAWAATRFFVGGNPSGAPIPVISNDFKGHSGIILHSVESADDWPATA